jgi:hypothetical protein
VGSADSEESVADDDGDGDDADDDDEDDDDDDDDDDNDDDDNDEDDDEDDDGKSEIVPFSCFTLFTFSPSTDLKGRGCRRGLLSVPSIARAL